jgi:hypothetical protein
MSDREIDSFDLDERLTAVELQLAEQPLNRSFGSKDHQILPADVASMLLTLWHERQPAQFGAYLAEVMTGTPPNGRNTRK